MLNIRSESSSKHPDKKVEDLEQLTAKKSKEPEITLKEYQKLFTTLVDLSEEQIVSMLRKYKKLMKKEDKRDLKSSSINSPSSNATKTPKKPESLVKDKKAAVLNTSSSVSKPKVIPEVTERCRKGSKIDIPTELSIQNQNKK